MQSVEEFMGSMVQRLSITCISNRIDKNLRSARGWSACLVRMSKGRARPVRMRILINPVRISSELEGKRSHQIVPCSLSLNVISRIYVITYAQAKGVFVLKLVEPVITLKKNVFDIWVDIRSVLMPDGQILLSSPQKYPKGLEPKMLPPASPRAPRFWFGLTRRGSRVQQFSGSQVRS
jgi:hypothetical protein